MCWEGGVFFSKWFETLFIQFRNFKDWMITWFHEYFDTTNLRNIKFATFLKCYMNWLSQFERNLGQNSQCVLYLPISWRMQFDIKSFRDCWSNCWSALQKKLFWLARAVHTNTSLKMSSILICISRFEMYFIIVRCKFSKDD